MAQPLRGDAPTNPQPTGLQTAIYATVHGTRGLSKVIADALDENQKVVLSLADPSRRVPLKAFQIPAMVRATRCFAVLDWLEAQVGRVAFVLPDAHATHDDELQQELARTVQAFGEFLQTDGTVRADGVIEPHEAAQLYRSIDQMIADLCEYKEMIRARVRTPEAAR